MRGPALAASLLLADTPRGGCATGWCARAWSAGTGRAATAAWSWCLSPRLAGRWSTRPPAGAALIAEIVSRLSPAAQLTVAQAFREFTDVAGEVPDSQWPAAVEEPSPGRPAPVQPGRKEQPAAPARGRVNMKERA